MGKVFEFYRRAAAGNGDTGTPVPGLIFGWEIANPGTIIIR